MRAQRRALTPVEQALAAHALAKRVAATRLFRVCDRIACYIPNDGEIGTREILERIWGMCKTAFLPVVSRTGADRLAFAEASPGTKLRPNRFGIPEPVFSSAALVPAARLDLILLPLVAFDAAGHRLGMGRGFYDRSLEFLDRRIYWKRPRLLGLAYDFQRLERLPVDERDVALDGIVTDRALYMSPDRKTHLKEGNV